ncbi:hypothetical protein EVG20_g11143, partial [Dentipellis fragilis]
MPVPCHWCRLSYSTFTPLCAHAMYVALAPASAPAPRHVHFMLLLHLRPRPLSLLLRAGTVLPARSSPHALPPARSVPLISSQRLPSHTRCPSSSCTTPSVPAPLCYALCACAVAPLPELPSSRTPSSALSASACCCALSRRPPSCSQPAPSLALSASTLLHSQHPHFAHPGPAHPCHHTLLTITVPTCPSIRALCVGALYARSSASSPACPPHSGLCACAPCLRCPHSHRRIIWPPSTLFLTRSAPVPIHLEP